MTNVNTGLTFEEMRKQAEEKRNAQKQQQSAPARNNSAKAEGKEKAPVKYWLNIGVPVAYTDTETGEDVESFINLDVAIDLESIKLRNSRSSNVHMQALYMAKEELLESLLKQAFNTPQGETSMTDLQVQIRHVGENTEVVEKAEESPLLKAFRNRMS